MNGEQARVAARIRIGIIYVFGNANEQRRKVEEMMNGYVLSHPRRAECGYYAGSPDHPYPFFV